MSGRCETCRHWRPDDPQAGRWQWGSCNRAWSTDGEATDEYTDAYARPAHEPAPVDCELRTGKTFGCVQHEPKPGDRLA